MAKGSALAIIALLIGIGGIALGGYSLFVVQMGSGVHQTYNAEHTSTYTAAAEDTWYAIPDLSVSFQVDGGEHVYFSFTCYASLFPSSGICRMSFRLLIDSGAADDSLVVVGGTGILDNRIFSVALQYFGMATAAGTHTVVVQTMFECDIVTPLHISYIQNCYLLVQTYTP